MIYDILGITFARFEHIFYLPLLISAVGLIWWQYIKQKKVVGLLVHEAQQGRLLKNYNASLKLVKPILSMAALCALFIASLQPQWGQKEELVKQDGRDLLLAVDISRSMLAQDCKPDRLTFTKNKIKKLLKQLSCERVGLIVFSGSAFVQCPLTSDYSAFNMFLNQLDADTISDGSTIISNAIGKGIDMYKDMPAKRSRLLVIFTDGEDFSPNLGNLKQQAAQEGLTIFTMGVGSPAGAPIPHFNEDGAIIGHQKDTDGSIVISQLNEGILQNLATDLSGVYIKTTPTNKDIKQLVGYVNQFEKDSGEDRLFSQKQEQYQWFIGIALACLVGEWLL